MAEKERNQVGWKSWEVSKAVARNRECWSENSRPYAPTGVTRHDDDDENPKVQQNIVYIIISVSSQAYFV